MDPNLQNQTIPTQPSAKNKQKRTFFTLTTILLICVVLVILLALYFIYSFTIRKNSQAGKSSEHETAKTTKISITPQKNVPSEDEVLKKVVCARFTDLQDALKHVEKACVLDLSNQKLATVPSDITKLTKLIDLNLSKNNFSEFPQILFELKNVGVINLSDNKINALPEKIWSLENLTALLLSNNNLSSLPAGQPQDSLKTLWLDGNKISGSQIEKIQKSAPNIDIKQ